MNRFLSNRYSIVLIILISIGLRTLNIDADIPYFVDHAYMPDEGGWSNNARNYYITGNWLTETHNAPYFTAPGYSYILYVMFEIFGVSLNSGRLLSSISGTITILLLWAFLIKHGTLEVANLAALLMSFTGIHVIYSRLLMTEAFLTFLFIFVIYLWGKKYNLYCAVISGVIFSAMVVTKISAIYTIPSLIVLVYCEKMRGEVNAKQILSFFAGSIVCIVILLSILFMPHKDQLLLNYSGVERMVSDTLEISVKYLTTIFLFSKGTAELNGQQIYNKVFSSIPILTLLIFVYIAKLLLHNNYSLNMKIKALSYVELVGLSIIAGNIISIGLSSYQPERRYVLLLPGIAMLASSIICNYDAHKSNTLQCSDNTIINKLVFNAYAMMPIFIYFSYTIYVLGGNWNIINLGKEDGTSFYGQALLESPLYIVTVYYLARQTNINLVKYILYFSTLIICSQIIMTWLYYYVKYYHITLSAKMTVTLTWVIFTISCIIFKYVKCRVDNKSIYYIILGFMLFQGIIIGYTLIFTSNTYANIPQEINKVINDNPLITETSGPFISKLNMKIYYGFPQDIIMNNLHEKYYILNIAEKAGYKYDTNYLYYLRTRKSIPCNAELKGTYSLIPYGEPQRHQLKLCLWEVQTIKCDEIKENLCE